MGIFEGMNLEIVVVYEFGYVLGFSYLSILEVLMVLYYQGYDLNYEFYNDDI